MSKSLKKIRSELEETSRKLGKYWSEWNKLHPIRPQPEKREKELQRIIGLSDSEFQRLKSAMSEQQLELFIDSVLKKQKTVENFSQLVQEESKPLTRTQNISLRDRMQARGWR